MKNCTQLLEGVKSRYVSRNQNFFDLFYREIEVLDKEGIVGNMITFELHPHLLVGREENLYLFSQLIAQLGLRKGLDILVDNTYACPVSLNSLEHLIQAIKDKGFAEKVCINLTSKKLGPVGAKYIGDLIAATGLAKDAMINLAFNEIGNEGAKYIAEGIMVGGLAEGCTICLSDNMIGDEGIQYVLDAISKRGAPKGVKILCTGNPISKDMVDKIDVLNHGILLTSLFRKAQEN